MMLCGVVVVEGVTATARARENEQRQTTTHSTRAGVEHELCMLRRKGVVGKLVGNQNVAARLYTTVT
jgi:hypothetical protein